MALNNKDKEIASKNADKEVSPLGEGTGVAGVHGMTQKDLNMPYVYLVRESSRHAIHGDGSRAEPGTFFHNVKKKSYEQLEVIAVHAQRSEETNEERDEEQTVWRVLMVETSNLYSPFMFKFSGMNYWSGWRDFLSQVFYSSDIEHISDRVLTLTSEKETTQSGNEFHVVKIEVGDDVTEEQKKVVEALSERFDVPQTREQRDEEEMDEEEIDVDELIDEIDAE